jgi:hypothetical protein
MPQSHTRIYKHIATGTIVEITQYIDNAVIIERICDGKPEAFKIELSRFEKEYKPYVENYIE